MSLFSVIVLRGFSLSVLTLMLVVYDRRVSLEILSKYVGERSMMKEHDRIIEELRKISTPIVYDAIEKFNVRSSTQGYTDSSIRSIFPSLGVLIGYACTGKIVGVLPKAEGERSVPSKEVWRYVSECRKPSVMVIQDLDDEPRRACAWGDYSASIFTALGCRGAITNGYVRDIEVVEPIGFQLFAKSPIAGHGHIRYVEIDTPVKIGGLIVKPGDLIHADQHGVVIIPDEIPLGDLLRVVKNCLESEGKVIDYCKSPEFTLDGLFREVDEHEKRAGGHFK